MCAQRAYDFDMTSSSRDVDIICLQREWDIGDGDKIFLPHESY